MRFFRRSPEPEPAQPSESEQRAEKIAIAMAETKGVGGREHRETRKKFTDLLPGVIEGDPKVIAEAEEACEYSSEAEQVARYIAMADATGDSSYLLSAEAPLAKEGKFYDNKTRNHAVNALAKAYFRHENSESGIRVAERYGNNESLLKVVEKLLDRGESIRAEELLPLLRKKTKRAEGKDDPAVVSYEKTQYAWAATYVGLHYLENGQTEAARRVLQKNRAMMELPDSLGDALLAEGDLKGAYGVYLRSADLRAVDHFLEAHRSGNEQAIEWAAKLAREKKLPEAHLRIALYDLERGEFDHVRRRIPHLEEHQRLELQGKLMRATAPA